MRQTRQQARLSRMLVVAGVLVSGLILQGCATQQNRDPLEAYNRKVFAFNDGLDQHVLKPAAEGYKAATPDFFRTAVTNFVNNLTDVWSAVNLFLQGHPGNGATQIMRVSVNTVFGLGGLIDMATPMRLERQSEDFGQTLGVWGVPSGAYIVWPVLGSSTFRDSVGLPADLYFSPSTVMATPAGANIARVTQLVNTRANVLGATDLLQDIALDKYSFVRDAYLQRRISLIYNGEPPEEEDVPYEDERYDEPEQKPTERPQSLAPSLHQGSPVITVAERAGLRADEVVR